jgi:hypothetical protein
MLPLIEREAYRHADNDWNITTMLSSAAALRARQPMEAQGLRTKTSKLEAMAREKCRDPFRRRKTKTKKAGAKAGPRQGERWHKGARGVQSHSKRNRRAPQPTNRAAGMIERRERSPNSPRRCEAVD